MHTPDTGRTTTPDGGLDNLRRLARRLEDERDTARAERDAAHAAGVAYAARLVNDRAQARWDLYRQATQRRDPDAALLHRGAAQALTFAARALGHPGPEDTDTTEETTR